MKPEIKFFMNTPFSEAVQRIENDPNYKKEIEFTEIVKLINSMERKKTNDVIPTQEIVILTALDPNSIMGKKLPPRLPGKFYRVLTIEEDSLNTKTPIVQYLLYVNLNGSYSLYTAHSVMSGNPQIHHEAASNFLDKRSIFAFEDPKTNAKHFTNELRSYLRELQNQNCLKLLLKYFDLPSINLPTHRSELSLLSEVQLTQPIAQFEKNTYVLFLPGINAEQKNRLCSQLDQITRSLPKNRFYWDYKENIERKMATTGCVTHNARCLSTSDALFLHEHFLFNTLLDKILGTEKEQEQFWPNLSTSLNKPIQWDLIVQELYEFNQSPQLLIQQYWKIAKSMLNAGFDVAEAFFDTLHPNPFPESEHEQQLKLS